MDGTLLDTREFSIEQLEAQITELAGHLNAAQYRWLLLIREFDRRNGWGDGKLASCAHWLNFKCGLNLGAAREKVRVAHALSAQATASGNSDCAPCRAISTKCRADFVSPAGRNSGSSRRRSPCRASSGT